MFPGRFFPTRYYPTRYYPKTGGTPGPGGGYYPGRYFAQRYFAQRYFPAAANPTPALPPDLVAAAVAWVRSFNGGAVAAALGETVVGLDGFVTRTAKVWSDEVLGSPGLPWMRFEEPIGVREYSSDFNYIETGQLQVTVVAASRLQARKLGWMLAGNPGSGAGALDDPALVFSEGRLMYFRFKRAFFTPSGDAGFGAPVEYVRVLLFDYRFSGQG